MSSIYYSTNKLHMDFRQTLTIDKGPFELSYSDNCLLLGSCFADNIASRLNDIRFHYHQNPFGTLYNPLSVSRAIVALCERHHFTEKDLIYSNSLYHSFMHHSSFSRPTVDETLNAINTSIDSINIKKITTLVISIGTAWVYSLATSGEIVANCHKLPEKMFHRRRISVEESINALTDALKLFRSINPEIKIIMTVSPVRHLRDGVHENSLSKATLHLATEKLIESFENVDYFPAFELLMDDLRDYRFYADDMAHPSTLAVDYIFDAFEKKYFSKDTINISKEVHRFVLSLSHKQLTHSPEHIKFLRQLLLRMEKFHTIHPMPNLFDDIEKIKQIIK